MRRKPIFNCKVFTNGLSEICRRQPLKNLKWYGLLKHTLHVTSTFLKGCLPQFFIDSFLNTLHHFAVSDFASNYFYCLYKWHYDSAGEDQIRFSHQDMSNKKTFKAALSKTFKTFVQYVQYHFLSRTLASQESTSPTSLL